MLFPRNRTKYSRPARTPHQKPILRFTPWAWAKLLFLRDLGPTEVGGFGIAPLNDLLLVQDVVLVQQDCSPITVSFQDAAVAEFFDQQIDAGLRPEQFARVWIHTHPGSSAAPSSVDELTFSGVFGRSDWAVMAILAREGQRFARLQFRAGPGGSLRIPVQVDWSLPFAAADWAAWQVEYETCVRPSVLKTDCWLTDDESVEFAEFQWPTRRPDWPFRQPGA